MLSASSGLAISIVISTLAAAPSADAQFIESIGPTDALVRGALVDIVL